LAEHGTGRAEQEGGEGRGRGGGEGREHGAAGAQVIRMLARRRNSASSSGAKYTAIFWVNAVSPEKARSGMSCVASMDYATIPDRGTTTREEGSVPRIQNPSARGRR
jgi:hypothetical protein